MKKAVLVSMLLVPVSVITVCASGNFTAACSSAYDASDSARGFTLMAEKLDKHFTAYGPSAIFNVKASYQVPSAATSASAASFSGSYPPPSYTITSLSTSSSAFGVSSYPSVAPTRNIMYDHIYKTLKYRGTMNRSDKPLSERSDVYGTYDEYDDQLGNKFSYLHGTDLLFGALDFKSLDARSNTCDIPEYKAISVDKAKAVGISYVKSLIGDISCYEYKSYYYQGEANGYFCMQYVKKLAGYDTDDELIFWVTPKGKPVEFSTWNRGRYDRFKSMESSFGGSDGIVQKKITELGLDKKPPARMYITLSDNGRLQLAYSVGCSMLFADLT